MFFFISFLGAYFLALDLPRKEREGKYQCNTTMSPEERGVHRRELNRENARLTRERRLMYDFLFHFFQSLSVSLNLFFVKV